MIGELFEGKGRGERIKARASHPFLFEAVKVTTLGRHTIAGGGGSECLVGTIHYARPFFDLFAWLIVEKVVGSFNDYQRYQDQVSTDFQTLSELP